MPRRSATDVVEEFNQLLHKAGQPCLTLRWPDFYELCGRERLKQAFLDEVRNTASGRFQLIVAYGSNAVLVSHDRNFAELEGEK